MKARGRLCLTLLALLTLLCGCSRYTGSYKKAIAAFSEADYGTAAEIFAQCDPNVGNAAVYAAYSQGMVFWEQEQYTAAVPYFEQCEGFMYGTQRYRYCCGMQAIEDGDYALAQAIFEALEDFENAPKLTAYCRGCRAEAGNDYATALAAYDDAGDVLDANSRLLNLQTQIYSHAIELKNQGSYSEAFSLFTCLGDYLMSETYARECRNVDRESLYAQAEALEKAGELQEAYDKFLSLGVYRDAAQRTEDLAKKLGIPIVDETRPYQ